MEYKDLFSRQKKTLNTISLKQNKKIKSVFVNGKSFIHVGRVFFKEFKEIDGLNNKPTSKKPSKVEPALKSSKKINTKKDQKKPKAWIKNKDLVNLDRVFVDGKRSTTIDGLRYDEFNPSVKDHDGPTPSCKKFTKDSQTLKLHLNRLKKENKDFCLRQDPEKAGGLIVDEFDQIEIADLINLGGEFVDGKRIFTIDGVDYEEVDTPVEKRHSPTHFKKKSSNLQSALNKFKKNKESFRVEQDPTDPKSVIVHRFLHEDVKRLEKEFVNGTRILLIEDVTFYEVEAPTRFNHVVHITITSPNLKPFLESIKAINQGFRLDPHPNPKNFNCKSIHVFPDIEYPKIVEKKLANDKGSIINNGDLLSEVKAPNKKTEPAVYISKTSPKLQPYSITIDKKKVIPDLEYPNNLERKFTDGKRIVIIDGDLFEEVEASGKTAETTILISKKSFNLKPTLESFIKKNRTFRLDQDPKNLNTLMIHFFKPDPIKAIMRIKNNKRNTFCTFSTLDEKLFACTSAGRVKKRKKDSLVSVKGRERQSPHNIRAAGLLVQKEILKHNVTQVRLHHTGNAPRKKKKDFLNCIKGCNSIQIYEINRPGSRSHNGTRPKKIRRK